MAMKTEQIIPLVECHLALCSPRLSNSISTQQCKHANSAFQCNPSRQSCCWQDGHINHARMSTSI